MRYTLTLEAEVGQVRGAAGGDTVTAAVREAKEWLEAQGWIDLVLVWKGYRIVRKVTRDGVEKVEG